MHVHQAECCVPDNLVSAGSCSGSNFYIIISMIWQTIKLMSPKRFIIDLKTKFYFWSIFYTFRAHFICNNQIVAALLFLVQQEVAFGMHWFSSGEIIIFLMLIMFRGNILAFKVTSGKQSKNICYVNVNIKTLWWNWHIWRMSSSKEMLGWNLSAKMGSTFV